jgi:hypothetical protein
MSTLGIICFWRQTARSMNIGMTAPMASERGATWLMSHSGNPVGGTTMLPPG